MERSRYIMVLFCCYTLVQGIDGDGGIARSNVRSIGMVRHNRQGKPVHISLKQTGGLHDQNSANRQNAARAKSTCTRRIQMIVGSASLENFQKELLLCQYQELHAVMKKQQQDYERTLMHNLVMNITNPYRREYRNVTVNPHNFTFVHKPEPCLPTHTILISIHSAAQNFDKREAIRSTWGNPRIIREFLPKGHLVKLAFALGLPGNSSNQTLIDFEADAYADIIQANFKDHYHNNTYKAIYHLKWASGYGGCPKVQMIMKSDDDIMLNLRKFPAFWKNFTKEVGKLDGNLIIAGNEFLNTGPLREPGAKWYIPYHVFKYDTFPPWFQGMVYFLTPQLAERIYDLSFTTPYLFTDDVYVGIVADRVHGIQRLDLSQYYNWAYDPLDKKLLRWRFDTLVFYHNPNMYEMYRLWFYYCTFRSCR